WRLALWHYGLPIALTALLHDPRGPHGPAVARAFRTLVRGEVADPRWNGYPNGGRTSLWTLWWRLEALTALTRVPLAGNADVLHWLPDAAVVQRAHARERPLAELLPHGRLIDPAEFARRHWAAFLLVLVCLGSAGGVSAGLWGWKDFWLSVILPVVLTAITESMRRRRTQRGPPRPPPERRRAPAVRPAFQAARRASSASPAARVAATGTSSRPGISATCRTARCSTT